jgi:hypothetical protein
MPPIVKAKIDQFCILSRLLKSLLDVFDIGLRLRILKQICVISNLLDQA